MIGFAEGPTAWIHHATCYVRGESTIDMHTSIIAPGRARVDLEGVWSRTEKGWPAGAEYLEPVDALVRDGRGTPVRARAKK